MNAIDSLPPVADSDVAYTKQNVADRICEYLYREHGLGTARSSAEPCAGDGVFVRSLLRFTAGHVVAIDLDADAPILSDEALQANPRTHIQRGDLFESPFEADWVVTNSAFTILDRLIPRLVERCHDGFALLLLTQAFNPGARDHIWEKYLPAEHVRLKQRCAFERPRAEKKIEAARQEAALLQSLKMPVPAKLAKLAKKRYNPNATDMREYSFYVWLRQGLLREELHGRFNSPTMRDRRLCVKTGKVWG